MSKQVTVFIENRKNSLTEVTRILSEAGINVFSFSLADTDSFGLLRMVVTDPEKAVTILKEHHVSVSLTEVTIVNLENKPGSLHEVLNLVNHLDVEYLYMYANRDDLAGIVFKFAEKEKAESILQENGYQLIGDLY